MKKIFSMLVIVLVALSLFVSISATDMTVADTYIEVYETVYETVDETLDEELTEEEAHTLVTRLTEFITNNKQELLQVGCDGVIVILAIVIKLVTGKKTASIEKVVNSIKEDTKNTNGSQASVVGAVNNMIGGYNALQQSYERYGETEADRNRLVGAVLASNTAILEILTTVYPHSKNLPQGAKDIVMLTYANYLKALEDDEKLAALVASVREGINGNAVEAEPTEEQTTEAEE